MPPAITPRPRIKRTDRDLASFLDPGAPASFLRSDGSTWQQVMARVFEIIRDPDSRPETIRAAVAELRILANAADECAREVRQELTPNIGE